MSKQPENQPNRPELVYSTQMGSMWHGDSRDFMADIPDASVNLILTSPPFALTRKKSYGNESEAAYVDWFRNFAVEFHRILAEDGSLVIDLGGAWLPGSPTRSLYQFRLLIDLVDNVGFHLAEDFYWFNRAKLPGPRQWATIERTRVKDAVNTIWWLSKTPHPKANNLNVLKPYSKSMQRLLRKGTYNDGQRPSEHVIGKNWAKDLGGAIPPNVIETDFAEPDNMLDYPNTSSADPYHAFCRSNALKRHPARFPDPVPKFFIEFLTDERDLVLDPFAGSNVSGAIAEDLKREWVSIELDLDYIPGSLGRFAPDALEDVHEDLSALNRS